MIKKILAFALLILFSSNLNAQHWGWRRYGGYYGGRYDSRISPGAATAIGLGTGVLGYYIGRTQSKNENRESDRDRIECKEFDVKVKLDGEYKNAKILKCRVGNGDWKIPE